MILRVFNQNVGSCYDTTNYTDYVCEAWEMSGLLLVIRRLEETLYLPTQQIKFWKELDTKATFVPKYEQLDTEAISHE